MTDKVRNFSVTVHRYSHFLWLLLLLVGSTGAAELTLSADTVLSNDGVFHLSWTLPPKVQVQIQRSSSEDFAESLSVYQGVDQSSVITGLTDGHYFFRGRLQYADGHVSAWSKALLVSVKHHPLSRALLFFSIGAVVFVATLLLIVHGARRGNTA